MSFQCRPSGTIQVDGTRRAAASGRDVWPHVAIEIPDRQFVDRARSFEGVLVCPERSEPEQPCGPIIQQYRRRLC
jgi:hypothetical protein